MNCSHSPAWWPWSGSCLPPCKIDGGTWSTNSRRKRAGDQSSETSSSLPDARRPWQPIRCMELSAQSPAIQTRTPRGHLTSPSQTWTAQCVRKEGTKHQAAPHSSGSLQQTACKQPSGRDCASCAYVQGTSRGSAPPRRRVECAGATSGMLHPCMRRTGASSGGRACRVG